MRAPGSIPADQVEAAVAELNREHAIIFDGSRTLVWSDCYDHALRRPVWRQSSIADFRAAYAAHLVWMGNRPRSLADVWLAHADARRYRDVVFDPTGAAAPRALNLWRGFAVTPEKGDWSHLREHLYEIVAGGSPVCYDYLLGWMAALVQYPADPGGTAIVLMGRPGAGKGILVRALGRLLGPHFVHLSHTGQLTSRFNGHLSDALLVFADEAVWAGDRPGEGALKALITEPTISIERKGREVMAVRNVTHIVMASNGEWVAPVGIGDRRFAVLEVSDARTGNLPYFRDLAHEQQNGGASALLYDLLHYDLTQYQANAIPDTRARQQQASASLDPTLKWWQDRLIGGHLDGAAWPLTIGRDTLYKDYLDTATKWRVTHPQSQAWLGRTLHTLLPGLTSGQDTIGDRFYRLPPLARARKMFEQHLGQEIDWQPDALETDDL